MDEEYDVIVLGTGLTVSATSGAGSPVSPHPLRSAAAPSPILSLPSVALPPPVLGSPEKTAPCPPPHDVASTHHHGPFSEKRTPFSLPPRLPGP